MNDIEKIARELLATAYVQDGMVAAARRIRAGQINRPTGSRQALRAIISAFEPQWQPIETAPRDGTRLLLFGDGDTVVAYFNVGYGTWDDGDHHDDIQGLTHWQPLPAAP